MSTATTSPTVPANQLWTPIPAPYTEIHRDAIERFIAIAHCKGLHHRFPHRFHSEPDFADEVHYVMDVCDRLEIPWRIQNRALQFINQYDDDRVWAYLYTQAHKGHAADCIADTVPDIDEMVRRTRTR